MADKRQAVQDLVSGGLSVQRACSLLQLHRSTFRYAAHPRDETLVVARLHALAAQNPRYGYRRMHVLLNQSEPINHKRECLNLDVFSSLAEAHVRLSAFRQHYNGRRPHSRLGYLTPLAFKKAWLEAQANLQDPLIST